MTALLRSEGFANSNLIPIMSYFAPFSGCVLQMEPMQKRLVEKERLCTSTLSPMTGCVVLMMEGVLELSKWAATLTLTTPPCPRRVEPSLSDVQFLLCVSAL